MANFPDWRASKALTALSNTRKNVNLHLRTGLRIWWDTKTKFDCVLRLSCDCPRYLTEHNANMIILINVRFDQTDLNVLFQLIMHTTSSLLYAWKLAEKAVSRTGRSWMWTLLPTGQISTLLSFLLFSYVIRASFLTWFLPLALLGIATVVMLISTLRLVRGKSKKWFSIMSPSTTQGPITCSFSG